MRCQSIGMLPCIVCWYDIDHISAGNRYGQQYQFRKTWFKYLVLANQHWIGYQDNSSVPIHRGTMASWCHAWTQISSVFFVFLVLWLFRSVQSYVWFQDPIFFLDKTGFQCFPQPLSISFSHTLSSYCHSNTNKKKQVPSAILIALGQNGLCWLCLSWFSQYQLEQPFLSGLGQYVHQGTGQLLI